MAGGLSDIFDGGAAAGGKGLGVGLLAWTLFQAFKFTCNFLAGRHDARQTRLDELDVRLAKSLGDRLSHLEQAERTNQIRIQTLEGWVATLATELRMQDPTNPKLRELAEALRGVTPIVASDPRLDELMQHAANAVDRKGRQ